MVPISIGGKIPIHPFGVSVYCMAFAYVPFINLTHLVLQTSKSTTKTISVSIESTEGPPLFQTREARGKGRRDQTFGKIRSGKNDENMDQPGGFGDSEMSKKWCNLTSHVAWYSGLQIAWLALFEIR